ncbi:MAG: murein biosynthesis integral membrane protein MurJ [Acidimicrobiia bacterium]|nr:murein biosynthesis integral membrane protein MurJ [Acidimicrobiia bacterium]
MSRRTTIGAAALVVSGGIVLSRVLGLLRDLLIANLLGATAAGDIYFAAFFIPDLLFYLMAGGYMTITFIPILSRYFVDDDEEGAWRSFAAVVRPVTLVMTVLTALTIIFARPLVDLLFVRLSDWLPVSDAAKRLTEAQLTEVASLTRIVAPAQLFFLLGSLLMAVQYAKRQFLIPALAPLVYNLSIIAGGLISWAIGKPSPAGFVYGALAGAIIGNFSLQVYGARRAGLRWMPGTPWRHPSVWEYAVLALPLMLGQSIAVLDEQFVRIFGQWAGEGSITQLGLARRLNMLPVGMIAQAAGVAAYPFLTRLFAEGRHAELAATLRRALQYTFFAGAAATAAVLAASQPAVKVVFERGEFTTAATVGTAAALVPYAFSIPVWGAHQLYARGFYARREMWVPVTTGTIGTVVGVGLYIWLFELMGTPGMALASTLAMVVYTVLMATIWYHRTGTAELRPLLISATRSAVAAGLAAIAGWWAVSSVTGDIAESSFWRSLGSLAVGALVVGAVFVGVARLLRAPELAGLRRRQR